MKATLCCRIVVFCLGALFALSSQEPFQAHAESVAIDAQANVASSAADKKVLYKTAIERYFNAYIKADLDTLLDSLHPDGPVYPDPAAIKQLRATASGKALAGEALVKEMTVLEEKAVTARVKVTLHIMISLYKDDKPREEISHLLCELRLQDGKWRLFEVTK